MAVREKRLNERDIHELLERTPLQLEPLELARLPGPGGSLIFGVSWKEKQLFRLVAVVKARATSQLLAAAAQRAKSVAFDIRETFPLVIVPYLSPRTLGEAERLGISAIDLCGNGIVQVPHRCLVFRSGSPNRYRGSEPLRSAYRGIASLVGRAFLVQPSFARVSDVHDYIRAHHGNITLGTVSKVLALLAEDLVIARDARGIRLLQPDKLMSELRDGYQPPEIRSRFAVKSTLSDPELLRRLREATNAVGGRLVVTGVASASHQAVFAADPMITVYCTERPEDLLKAASVNPIPQRRFSDLELLQTDDERVYFDARDEDGRLLCSPIQTWLELATGDKRSQEVADDLRTRILEMLRESRDRETR